MRSFTSFLFTFLFCLPLMAQSPKDSLVTKSYKELDEMIDVHLKSEPQNALNIALYHIAKAKKENNELEEFNALDNFIYASIWFRKFDNFDKEYQRLLVLATENQLDLKLMESFERQGDAYFYQGVWSKMTAPYYKSLEIARKLNDIAYQHRILTQLGYIKSINGDLKQAIKLQNEALQLIKNAPLDSVITSDYRTEKELRSLYYISRSYVYSKKIDSAKSYNDKALRLNMKFQDSCIMRHIYLQGGDIKLMSNLFEAALIDLDKSNNYCTPLSKLDSLVVSTRYGKAYLGLKQYQKAAEVLQRGLDIYPVKKGEEGFMEDHYKLLAKAYKHINEIEKSNFYFEKYVYTIDEFTKIQDSVASNFKQKEIDTFKNELNVIESEKNKQKNNVIYIALGATVIILMLLVFLLNFYQSKKKNDLRFQELLSKLERTHENTTSQVVDTKDQVLEETATSDVSEEVTQQILEGLLKLETQEYYLKQDCNAYNVAKKIKTNTSYLSKVVNTHFQKNFNTYINDLRINYAIVRLKNDTRFRSYSIQSIAEELGYKSADSFTKYFKQDTGLNPSFYIKQLNQLS